MQILRINKEAEDEIASLRIYAEEHITPPDAWEETAALHGDAKAKNVPFKRNLPGGWQVIFSINACSDGTLERLLTVRHESQVPDFTICNILLGYFGFARRIAHPALHVMHGPNAVLMFENFSKR